MKYTGYHRTSTKEQHLDRGLKEIMEYCKGNGIRLHKDKVYCDQSTGKHFNRPQYQMLREEVLEAGDILMITEIDRLGRNKEDTLKELRYLKDMGVRVMVLEIPTTCVDYGKYDNGIASMLLETVNNMLIEMFASLAQAELEKREKRQREGIQAMKDRGEWEKYGRKRVMQFSDFSRQL